MAFFGILVVAIVGYFVLKAYLSSGRASTSATQSDRGGARGTIPGWLQERWDLARRVGAVEMFPAWYFDPMTEFQAKRLEEDGRRYSGRLTKGQASDLIGLAEQPDEDDQEVLRFFKRPLRGMNETRARHEIALLFQEDANRRAWAERPATARQREFFRFFGLKPTAGLLKREADEQITQRLNQAREQNDPRSDQWRTYDALLDDFDDPGFRETYDIRKPGLPSIRKAIEELLADGKTWADIDADSVAERLIEVNPRLER